MNEKQKHGSINWHDLTVEHPVEIREFYREVIGWNFEEVAMQDDETEYSDFLMKSEEGSPVAGICAQRGNNQGIPPQWIMYISVDDVELSVKNALKLGAKLIKEQKAKDGSVFYAILEDPAGAFFALAKREIEN